MEAGGMNVLGEWPSGTMDAVEMVAPERLEVVDRPVPPPEHGSVLVDIAYIGICGTDTELLNGRSAFVREGLVTYPIAFGHEWSGTVVAAAEGTGFHPGDNVVGTPFRTCCVCDACRSGHENVCRNHDEIGVRGTTRGAAAEYLRAPAKSVTKLPEEVSLLDGALVEPSVTAVQAVLRARVRWDDSVAVIGTGTLGLQALQVALHSGAEVHAIGIEPAGLDRAKDLGASWAGTPEETSADRYTVVIEASGAFRRWPPPSAFWLQEAGLGWIWSLLGAPRRSTQAWPSSRMPDPRSAVRDLQLPADGRADGAGGSAWSTARGHRPTRDQAGAGLHEACHSRSGPAQGPDELRSRPSVPGR